MEDKVIGIGVALVLIGVLFPLGLGLIANATLTNVNASVKTIFTVLLPILAIIGAAIWMYRSVKS